MYTIPGGYAYRYAVMLKKLPWHYGEYKTGNCCILHNKRKDSSVFIRRLSFNCGLEVIATSMHIMKLMKKFDRRKQEVVSTRRLKLLYTRIWFYFGIIILLLLLLLLIVGKAWYLNVLYSIYWKMVSMFMPYFLFLFMCFDFE